MTTSNTTTFKSSALFMATHATGNVFLLHELIFPMMEEDSLTMAHLDPSIIIATPIPFVQIYMLISSSLIWNILLSIAHYYCQLFSKQKKNNASSSNNHTTPHIRPLLTKIMHASLMIITTSLIFHALLIICGVHPLENTWNTFLSSLYLAINIIFPIFVWEGGMPLQTEITVQQSTITKRVASALSEVIRYLLGPITTSLSIQQQDSLTSALDKKLLQNQQKQQNQLMQGLKQYQKLQILHQCNLLGIIVGMGACTILQILDHGMQIQRFPIPILLGVTWGEGGGVILGLIGAALVA